MEARHKPHMDEYEEMVFDLENFKHLIFVAQSVPGLLTELHSHCALLTLTFFSLLEPCFSSFWNKYKMNGMEFYPFRNLASDFILSVLGYIWYTDGSLS
jgi:hypothetical protein